MGFNNVLSRPADHRVASSTVYENFFLDNETVSFTVSGTAAVTYELRNDWTGATVSTGSVGGAGATVSLGVLPLGAYKLYFVRSTPIAAPWLSAGGEVTFAVVRATSVLKARPTAGTARAASDTIGNGFDMPARGMCGVGPIRHQIRLDATNYAADKAGVLADIAYENTYRNPDSARPLKQFVAFPNFDVTVSAQVTNMTDAVQACVAAGAVWFESVNEPNATFGGDPAVYQTSFNTFCDTVHAASASAKTMGPCTVDIYGDYTVDSGTGARYSYQIITTAGASRVDALSFHNYNGGQGELPSARRAMDRMAAMTVAAGIGSKPRFNTEFGSQYSASNGSYEPRRQGQLTMIDLHLLEQYAIPKEQTYLFYDQSHGFWGFPSWWMHAEGSEVMPTPTAPLMRVWAEELWGKPFSARLSLGIADDLYLASRFAAADGTSTVVVQSSGHTDTLRVTVTGGVSSLVTVDAWGNLVSRAVDGGILSMPVDALPAYIRCPVGVTAAPVVQDGIELVRGQSSTATASTGSATAARAIDGVTYQGTPGTTNNEWVGTAVASTWQTNFPVSTRVNRFTVFSGSCTLQDFDIQVLQSAVWNTVATFTESNPFKMWASWKSAGACYVDTWGSRRNQWSYRPTSPVTCDGVRLNIRGASYGGAMIPESVAQQSIQVTGSPTGGTFKLTWNAIETATIVYNPTPAAALSALQATTGGSTWTAAYGSTLANGIIVVGKAIWPITATSLALTGGTSPTVVVTALGTETGGRLSTPDVATPQLREVPLYLNEYDLGKTASTPLLPFGP